MFRPGLILLPLDFFWFARDSKKSKTIRPSDKTLKIVFRRSKLVDHFQMEDRFRRKRVAKCLHFAARHIFIWDHDAFCKVNPFDRKISTEVGQIKIAFEPSACIRYS